MATVELRNVHKRSGKAEVIRDVSLDIADGEFVVLIGPSGCGKSTLLRMIAGLEPISSGTIAIDGEVVNDMSPRQRGISMVFQSYALYPHMTSAENMTFSLRLAGESADVQAEKLDKVAGILGLGDYLERLPRQLSGGQRQRVAMGRAIVRDPQVFLFDEPLSNLDAQLRIQMRTEIKELHQRLKTTTIFVTHDQIEAMTMADKIVVMREGEVEQIGTPYELYSRPQNTFVAQFIGSPSMNLMQGAVRDGRFDLGGGLTIGVGAGAPEGEPVQLGFRPEHAEMAPDGLPFTVEVVEPTGADTQVHGRLGDHEIICSFRDYIELDPGQTIPVRISADRLHLFNTDGARLQPECGS